MGDGDGYAEGTPCELSQAEASGLAIHSVQGDNTSKCSRWRLGHILLQLQRLPNGLVRYSKLSGQGAEAFVFGASNEFTLYYERQPSVRLGTK